MTELLERVCVIGLGYVGLPTATMLAAHGIEVVGVDIDAERAESINSRAFSSHEPNLDVVVSQAVAEGKLHVQDKPGKADVFIIAVPTPIRKDRRPDLRHLHVAVNDLASALEVGNLVLVESTLPVGATETISEWLAQARVDLTFPHAAGENSDIRVAYCPERVLPGHILKELVDNDRVIGGVTPACAAAAKTMYQVFVQGSLHLTTTRTAELIKLAENAYRDVNIAFANEMSLVCEALDINPWEMISLANQHPRVNILKPGPGVGGHCIPIDPWFIINAQPKTTPLLYAARQVNDNRPNWVARRVVAACAGIHRPVIACLGLAYKADVDDLRNSPSVAVIRQLQALSTGRIQVVEPHASTLPTELADNGETELVDLDTALSSAHVIVLLTNHEEFRDIPPDRLSGKKIVNSWGSWHDKKAQRESSQPG